MIYMIVLAFIIALFGVGLLCICLYFDQTNKNIDTVFYSPINPEDDEIQIRELLLTYPRAVIVVPESQMNSVIFKNNTRVIVQ